METEPLKKEQIVCAFHDDFEKKICHVKKRVDVIIYFVIINALLTGGHLILKLPLIF